MDPGDAASQVDTTAAEYLSGAVGRRAKLRRMLRNLSQEQLGDLLEALGELSTLTNEEKRGRPNVTASDPPPANLDARR
jgi:hypothetical protein